jgi:hypothetical protein
VPFAAGATNYTSVRLRCAEGEYNDLATLLWPPHEHVILHVMESTERIPSATLALAGASRDKSDCRFRKNRLNMMGNLV